MTIMDKLIILNENYCTSIKISQKFVPMDPNKNKPTLVQMIDWTFV